MTEPRIRKAVEADISNVLPLMRELVEFENYATDFAVTEDVLCEQGFRRSPPDFHCLIAESGDELVGFLVYYFVPFTYRAKPNLIIKELYVADGRRSKGVGKLLTSAVAREAEQAGCGMIKSYVAKWNERGIRFYERLGATIDPNCTNSKCLKKCFEI
jgi:GNAT superfamily N-acetyltransferase